MSFARLSIALMLLVPAWGCSICCSPFDYCGPLCNGECGCGCCSTHRAGSYSGTMHEASYEEYHSAPKLAPTPARPRQVPTPARPRPSSPAPESTAPPRTLPETYEPSDTTETTPSMPDTSTEVVPEVDEPSSLFDGDDTAPIEGMEETMPAPDGTTDESGLPPLN